MKQTIAIAGLGWLGKPLAQHLSFLGHTIKGSVTTQKKASTFQKHGLDAYAVTITEDGVEGAVQGFLKHVEILIIMIPPGLRRNTGTDFVLKMSHFLSEIQQAKVPKVIFISSTSVYHNQQGTVSEKEIPKPTTEAGKQLFQVEQLFFNATGLQTTIVRFGGLIGGSRQPVRYLAGRTDLHGAKAPVNLIHRNDCIAIIASIIKQDAFPHIFNAVYPEHPTKKDYYTQKAIELALEPPKFKEPDASPLTKKVTSVRLASILDYSYNYPI